jgi:hypothetical protein
MRQIILLSFAVLFLLPGLSSAAEFRMEGNRLIVSTSTSEIGIEGGAVVYAKDKSSGETLLDTSAWTNRPSFSEGFLPTQSSSVSFQPISSTQGRLTYTLSGGQLIMDITADPAGDVVIQLTGSGGGIPQAIDLPIMNFQKDSVILGSGAEYLRSDPDDTQYTMYNDRGWFSPTVVIARGTNSVLAAWSETTTYAPENIELQHNTAYDHIILQSGRDLKLADTQKIVSIPWRVGTYYSWSKAAQRWKVKFEERTGAKPLWENRAAWVRNVHASLYATIQYYDSAKFAELASLVSPQKLMYFLWNGDRIVLFGDHTLADVIDRPTPSEMQALEQYGWPLVLYHPWMLIYTESGASARLSELSSKGWLPSGYKFNPDYAGTPGNWQSYWSDVKTNYYSGAEPLYVIHPGSDKFKDYLVRNFRNYCQAYNANGAYFDVLGTNCDVLFPESMKVIDGEDYVTGEVQSAARLASEVPELALMAEYQPPWLLPYVFYAWQGAGTYRIRSSGLKINHPLRVALTGSYSWTKESNSDSTEFDDTLSALLGGLPEVGLAGDYNFPSSRVQWSQDRVKLFCEEELFNDVPDTWESGALAYYRSQRTGNWFKLEAGSDYHYTEILPDGSRVLRLSKSGGYVPPGTTCVHKSDSDCSGCVEPDELTAFMNRWYANSQDVTMKELMEAIGYWKRGC